MGRGTGPFSNILPFWQAIVWADDTLSQRLATIGLVSQFQSKRNRDQPATFSLTSFLSDPNAALIGTGVTGPRDPGGKGCYVTVYAGRQPWLSQAGGGAAGTSSIQAAGASKVFSPGETLLIADSTPEVFVIHNVTGETVSLTQYGGTGASVTQNWQGAMTTFAGGHSTLQYSHTTASLILGQRLIASGYVQQITKNVDRTGVFDVAFDDTLIFLSSYRCLDMPTLAAMAAPTYRHVGDLLMGAWNSKTGQRGDAPGFYGIMPRDWIFKWVAPKGSTWPGQGDAWETSLETALLNLFTLATRYNFHFRLAAQNDDGTPCVANHATVECGPLGDSAGINIWGGAALVSRLSSLMSRDSTWHYGKPPSSFLPNAALAQEFGLIMVTAPTYEDTLDTIWNLIWCAGAGTGPNEVTLAAYWADDPDKDPGAVAWGPTTGVTLSGSGWAYTLPPPASGRKYYVNTGRHAFWSGQYYFLVSSQRWDGTWEYGIMNASSVVKYGIRENVLTHGNKKIKFASELLSAGAGACDYNADPVETWTWPVIFPRTSPSGAPTQVKPGQTLDIHYKGAVRGIQRDLNPASETYGQQIPTGAADTYLTYPYPPGDPRGNDPNRTVLLKTVIQIDESYMPGGYMATYTTGHGKLRAQHWEDQIARQLEHTSQGYGTGAGESSHASKFEGIPLLLSIGPTAWVGRVDHGLGALGPSAQVYFDHHNVIFLQPGGIVLTDNKGGAGTGESLRISFWCTIHGWEQYLDFWFAYPQPSSYPVPQPGLPLTVHDSWINPTRGSNNGGEFNDTGAQPINYGVFRLAMNGSGYRTGFHLHNSTSGLQLPRGHKHKKHQKIWEPNTYFVTVSSHHRVHHAHVTIENKHYHAAEWHDHAFELLWNHPTLHPPTPNVGWHLAGGAVSGWLGRVKSDGFHP